MFPKILGNLLSMFGKIKMDNEYKLCLIAWIYSQYLQNYLIGCRKK